MIELTVQPEQERCNACDNYTSYALSIGKTTEFNTHNMTIKLCSYCLKELEEVLER